MTAAKRSKAAHCQTGHRPDFTPRAAEGFHTYPLQRWVSGSCVSSSADAGRSAACTNICAHGLAGMQRGNAPACKTLWCPHPVCRMHSANQAAYGQHRLLQAQPKLQWESMCAGPLQWWRQGQHRECMHLRLLHHCLSATHARPFCAEHLSLPVPSCCHCLHCMQQIAAAEKLAGLDSSDGPKAAWASNSGDGSPPSPAQVRNIWLAGWGASRPFAVPLLFGSPKPLLWGRTATGWPQLSRVIPSCRPEAAGRAAFHMTATSPRCHQGVTWP